VFAEEPLAPFPALCDGVVKDSDASVHFARGDDWFDIYKALECLEMRFGGEEEFRSRGWADKGKIKLLKRTANSGRRARKKFDPPPHPM
jgi:hypothetical protein